MVVYHQVEEFITANSLFSPHEKLLVAVSGGADSLCLLDCLTHADHPVVIAHFDHQLRDESTREAERVRAMAVSRGCDFILGMGKDYGLHAPVAGIEDAARTARYSFLAEAALSSGCRTIVAGHHADDQVETILMHLLRGAGVDGLSGMRPLRLLHELFPEAWAEGLLLARPLLSIRRQEILDHCQERGLEPIVDPSNEDVSFLRNRIRHELLPLLDTYQENVRAALLRTGEIMRAIDHFLEDELQTRWLDVVDIRENSFWINPDVFASMPEALQYRLSRRVLDQCCRTDGDIDFSAVTRLRIVLLRGEPARCSLPCGLDVRKVGDRFCVAHRGEPIMLHGFPSLDVDRRSVNVPGETGLSATWQIEAAVVPVSEHTFEDLIPASDSEVIVVDQDQLDGPLVVRCWEQGDRFQPFGLEGGTQKVGDFFTNEGIPREARSRWPLLFSGNTLLWVIGRRRAEAARLRKNSQHAIVIRLIRSPGGGE